MPYRVEHILQPRLFQPQVQCLSVWGHRLAQEKAPRRKTRGFFNMRSLERNSPIYLKMAVTFLACDILTLQDVFRPLHPPDQRTNCAPDWGVATN